jgi:outer membrane protein
MEKLELQYKSRKSQGFQYVLDGSTLLLADGPNLTTDVKRFGFLVGYKLVYLN